MMTALDNTLGGTAGFGENSIARNDDGSFLLNITPVFENGINFYGTNYTSFYINTNGNVTFGSALSTYTPSGIAGVNRPMIAPFFADVDTRGGTTTASPGGTSTGTNLIWYDLDTVNDVITVTWDDVGYYNNKKNKVNAFQMQLIDLGGGNWTVRFVYENIDWTTGDASGGSNGLGGTVATAGFTAGNGVDYYQLPTSGNQTSMLNLDVNNGNQGEQAVWEFLSDGGTVFDLAISANTVNEFAASGTVVGTLSSVAVGPSATFNLVNNAGGRFVLVGNQLRVADGVLLDFEQRQRETVTIQVFDGAESATFDLEINIANVEPEVINAGNAGYTIVGGALNDTISTGSGVDTIYGGAGNDTLSSGGGNDTLDGGTGADTMTGGAGSDTYYVDNAGDVVVDLAADAGTDLVYSTVTFSAAGANQSGIENITLTGTGNINATGNALANILTGNSGNNVLDGGTGADTMTGGAGSDTYTVDNVGDDVVELAADAGTDLVNASVTFSAAGANRTGIENILLTGTGNINATGNALNNVLTGNSSDNVLDGATGADTMTGGAGSDSFTVDNVGDVVIEQSADAGTDLVTASVSFSAAGANQSGIENISLNGTGNINATGNALANILTGNSGNNVLEGGIGNDQLIGGSGNDTLIGGLGDDTLTGGAGADIFVLDLFDGSAHQYDTIADFSIADGDRIQVGPQGPASWGVLSFYLLGDVDIGVSSLGAWWDHNAQDLYVGVEAADLTADQFIFDTSGVSRIVSGTTNDDMLFGGLGDDILSGGSGFDGLYADAGNDFIDGGDGDDQIDGGSGNDSLLGGEGKDRVIGGEGNDTLDGGGGNDKLWGGAGYDTFVFSGAFARDVIYDFSIAEDKLDLRALGIDSAAELSTYARNSGTSVALDFGAGNLITISNMQVAQIHDGLFVV